LTGSRASGSTALTWLLSDACSLPVTVSRPVGAAVAAEDRVATQPRRTGRTPAAVRKGVTTRKPTRLSILRPGTRRVCAASYVPIAVTRRETSSSARRPPGLITASIATTGRSARDRA
jgi:hypothetical protein